MYVTERAKLRKAINKRGTAEPQNSKSLQQKPLLGRCTAAQTGQCSFVYL